MAEYVIRPVETTDKLWISNLITERWGSEMVVVHETVYTPEDLPGFIAMDEGERIGLITYHIEHDEIEIVTLDSVRPSAGVGSGLIDQVRRMAQEAGCRRLWVITTNDNLEALHFYQKRGFSLVAVHRSNVTKAREKKPEIPKFGQNGIPIRDEIELERILD